MDISKKIYYYSEDAMRRGGGHQSEDAIKKRIVDSVFVAYGAAKAEPVMIAKAALLPSKGKYNSRIYFSKKEASVDVAAFINGTMTRYLDYNDTYLSKEALHPSDNIPSILCCADAMGMEGKRAINAISISYQISCALSDAASIRSRGWDHVVYISISAAAGISALMSLGQEAFINALSLSIDSNISMRQTRVGKLSMWKGCTAGNAARNSIFATILAKNGLTGPEPIFEGEMGLFNQVSGKFKLDLSKSRITKTMIKNYPVEYHAMSAVDAALKLRRRIKGEIRSITVETFLTAYNIIVKGPEKLKPKTKETADHSMPYIIAYTLLHGAPTQRSYTRSLLNDREMASLVDKMEFVVSKKYNSLYPEYLPVRISITTSEGRFSEEVLFPKGHFKDPYGWSDLKHKGMSIIPDESLVDDLIALGKRLDRKSVHELFELMSNVNT